MAQKLCWSIAVILLVTRTIATETTKSNKQFHLKNIKNYNNEINEAGSKRSHNDEFKIESTQERDDSLNKNEDMHPESSDQPHSRQKRLIWVTDDGRLALPPGTTLIIAPTLTMPFIRYPPDGFHSNISISLPLTIDFDKLGLTDNQNPLGTLPPVFARSMGRSAGTMLADYVFKYLTSRKKRDLRFNDEYIKVNRLDADNDLPKLPEQHKDAFHGGERALLYAVLEDFIANFGLDGRSCVLRAICEIHSKPVHRYGLIGEFLKLFFTASLSPYSDLLQDYVEAEEKGKNVSECFQYFKTCPKSLFMSGNTFSSMTFADTNDKDSQPKPPKVKAM